MLHAGEVRLRRVGEEVVSARARQRQLAVERRLVDPQLRRLHRHVGRFGAAGAIELPDAVHRVVIVEGEQKAVAGLERIRLADQLEGLAGVGGEDRDVLLRVGAEELQHPPAATLDIAGRRGRGRVGGVRIAEHRRQQQIHVAPHLTLAVEASPRVVEIDVPLPVEARELAGAEVIEDLGGGIVGEGRGKPPPAILQLCACRSHRALGRLQRPVRHCPAGASGAVFVGRELQVA